MSGFSKSPLQFFLQGRVFHNKASVTMFLNGGQVEDEGDIKQKEEKQVKEEDWVEDASLPNGWSWRRTSDKSKLFRTPGGKIYTTRVEATRALLDMDGKEEEVTLMREGLRRRDGRSWTTFLPAGC